MADPRVPRFELHIRPMIRLLDREHMLPFGFDLWSYDDVKAHAHDILTLTRDGLMPTKSHGGPWPQEWIDLFARWKDVEFPRLEPGTASDGLTAARSGSQVTLTARGRVPSAGFTVWLDLEQATDSTREYRLVQEAPQVPGSGAERSFTARERFETDAAQVSLVVIDSTGRHDVSVASVDFVHLVGSFGRVMRQLAAVGIDPPPFEPSATPTPTTITLEGHELHLTADDMFTQLTGSPEALALLRQRIPTVRR